MFDAHLECAELAPAGPQAKTTSKDLNEMQKLLD